MERKTGWERDFSFMEKTKKEEEETIALFQKEVPKITSKILEALKSSFEESVPVSCVTYSLMLALVNSCLVFGDDEEDFHHRLKLAMKCFTESKAQVQEILSREMKKENQ